MKLHLPKLLLAAILIAAGSSAFAEPYTVTNSTSSETAFTNSQANDTVTFNMTGNGTLQHLHDSDAGNGKKTLRGNAVITQLNIKDGYSGREYIFAGSVSGSGSFTFDPSTTASNQIYSFNGDMSGYKGAITIASGRTSTLNFNTTTIGSATAEGSSEAAAGSITATNAASRVNLNNSTSYASIDTGILGITGASTVYAAVKIRDILDVSGLTSAIGGSGTVNLDSATINVSSAQFNNGSCGIFGSGLTINGLADTIITMDGSALSTRNTSTWNGGTLVMTIVDVTWNGGTDAVTWDTTAEHWTANGSPTAFMQNDRVQFNSSANLTLVSNISVNSMTVSGAGNTVALNTEGYAFTGSISLKDGTTLRLTGTGLGLAQISGAGNVEIQDATTVTLTGDKVMKLEGDLIVKGRSTLELTKSTDATKKTTVDFSSLKSLILDNSTLKANTDGAKEVAYRQFTLGTLAVAGESEIAIDGGNPYHGYVTIGNLINEEGTGARTLTLSSTALMDTRSIFDLNGAELNDGESLFEGTIKVEQKRNRSNGKTALNLKHGTVASKAVIELAVSNDEGSAALGIAADKVTVKGITGNKKTNTNLYILSGEQVKEVGTAFAGDGRDRTLIIKTAGNSYSTTATLGDHLNITKQDTGSQTFAGDTPDAINTVKVEGGELAFSEAVSLTITDLTVKSGATLTIGSSPAQTLAEGGSSAVQTLAADAPDAAPATGVNATGPVLLEGGSTINGGLNLTSTTTLTINNISNDSTITLNGALVLPTERQVTLEGDILRTLAWLGKDRRLDVFTGVASLQLGDGTPYVGDLVPSEATDLKNYFNIAAGLEAGSYSLGYTGAAEGGVVYIQKNVPEPTTATLSLLALAALAARRRRKN